jgi:hypothetical protein
MRQKRQFAVHNHSKVFNLINPFEGRQINRINELNGLHIMAEGYRFTSVYIKLLRHTRPSGPDLFEKIDNPRCIPQNIPTHSHFETSPIPCLYLYPK